MARPKSTHPTDLELEILKIIWREERGTVREVCDKLAPSHRLKFTSVHTIMEIMVRKGYLSVDRRSRGNGGNVYVAKVGQAKTTSQMMNLLARQLFGGSIKAVIQHLLHVGDLKRSELQELRKLLDTDSKEGKK